MLFFILIRQIAIMAILIGFGVFLCRKGMISEQGTKELGAILLKVIVPCVILRAYLTEYNPEKMKALLISFSLALLMYVTAMTVAYLLFGVRDRLSNFSAAFCNAGFIGIPLVQAVVGESGVFYIASSIALLNCFQWTWGIYIMSGQREMISFQTILKNPVVLSLVAGILFFVTRIPVPAFLLSVLGHITGMNTPIAMILIGSYMVKLKPKAFFEKRVLWCSLVRLVLIPLLTILVMKPFAANHREVLMAVLLTGITPIGANICVFAQQYNTDYRYSVAAVCMSTILSAVTVPAIYMLANQFL